MTERDIRPYGDSAVILSFEQNISTSVLQEVSAAADAVRRASLPGVLDIIPAYCTVTVLFDPWVTDCRKLIREINSLDLSPDLSRLGSVRHVSIPVLYGSPFPEDLAHVAEHSGLSVEDVIRLHTANEYPV